MLPPYLIQEIREREERKREQTREQPRLELPLPELAQVVESDTANDGRGQLEIQVWG